MARKAGRAEGDEAGGALPGASLVAQAAALDAAARGDAPAQEGAAGAPEPAPFWRTTPLEAMDKAQWESLCDGCGRCCLVKLEDEDTGQIHATDIGCRLFDADSCRCRDYDNRTQVVPDCVGLTPEAVRSLTWLPPTCGYRLVNEGKDLPWWHPLVSGTPDTVVEAGVSVRGKVHCSEDEIALEDVVDRIVRWPLAWPRAARGKGPGQASGKGAGGGGGKSAGPSAGDFESRSDLKSNPNPKPTTKSQPR